MFGLPSSGIAGVLLEGVEEVLRKQKTLILKASFTFCV